MEEQQTTGIKSADEMIEEARRVGLTVSVTTKPGEHSTVVTVEFGMVAPESQLQVSWLKSSHKGARWSMLGATRWELYSHKNIKRVRDVRCALASMGDEVERRAAREAQQQAGSEEQPAEGAEHYVTVNDGARISNALGPYLTEEEARANVGRVREFLDANDSNADAYEYGVFRVRGYGRKLGAGRLNGRISLTAPVAEEQQQQAAEERRVVEGEEPQLIMQGAPSWSEGERRFEAVEWLYMGALGYRVSLVLPSVEEQPGRLVLVADAVRVLVERAGREGSVVHRMGPGVVRVTSARGGMLWLRPVEEQQEAVSAPVSAEEEPGAGTVPAAPGVAREGTWGVPSALLGDEERATAEAERLVPRGERLTLRVVEGVTDRCAMEERRYVVGVVAAQLRAGARHSTGCDGLLVLRWEGVTTTVGLAA